MISREDLALVHLARLPVIRTRQGAVAPAILRSVLTTILIDADNGRLPISRKQLAEAVGIAAGGHLYQIVAGLMGAGLLDARSRRVMALGHATLQPLSVKVENLRKLARLPLCHDSPIDDPDGVALRRAPKDLLALRNRVVAELGVGLAYVGRTPRGIRDKRRLRLRAKACRLIRQRWRRLGGAHLCDQHLGHLIGIDANSVVHALRVFPEDAKPLPTEVAATP